MEENKLGTISQHRFQFSTNRWLVQPQNKPWTAKAISFEQITSTKFIELLECVSCSFDLLRLHLIALQILNLLNSYLVISSGLTDEQPVSCWLVQAGRSGVQPTVRVYVASDHNVTIISWIGVISFCQHTVWRRGAQTMFSLCLLLVVSVAIHCSPSFPHLFHVSYVEWFLHAFCNRTSHHSNVALLHITQLFCTAWNTIKIGHEQQKFDWILASDHVAWRIQFVSLKSAYVTCWCELQRLHQRSFCCAICTCCFPSCSSRLSCGSTYSLIFLHSLIRTSSLILTAYWTDIHGEFSTLVWMICRKTR